MFTKPRLVLTPRDQDILSTLSLRVRLLTLAQIARTWWHETASTAARRRLGQLREAGLLSSAQIVALHVGVLEAPIVCWGPAQPRPNLGAVAWRLKRRWSAAPQPAVIYFATRRCGQLFGGARRGKFARAFQVSHDLGVAEMFLAYRRTRPETVRRWIDEDRLAPYRRGEKLPDAVLATAPSAVPELVLEFGAGYGKSRVVAFHEDNLSRGLRYQIW